MSAAFLLAVTAGCGDAGQDVASDVDGREGAAAPAPDSAGVGTVDSADSGTGDAPAAAPGDATGAPGGTTGSTPADEQQAKPTAGGQWTAGDTRVDREIAGAAMLREIRTARHEDFDRIVLDFGADDVPGYRISYVDEPVRQCGSGNEVPLAGDGWLSIAIQPANAHTEEGAPTIRERSRAPGLPVLLELKLICDFEAVVEVVAGVTSPERYRSFMLRSPNRLVIDIRHPGA